MQFIPKETHLKVSLSGKQKDIIEFIEANKDKLKGDFKEFIFKTVDLNNKLSWVLFLYCGLNKLINKSDTDKSIEFEFEVGEKQEILDYIEKEL